MNYKYPFSSLNKLKLINTFLMQKHQFFKDYELGIYHNNTLYIVLDYIKIDYLKNHFNLFQMVNSKLILIVHFHKSPYFLN